jgi:acetone carboxylase gamma subunit
MPGEDKGGEIEKGEDKMKKLKKLLDNVEVVEEGNKEFFRCAKCEFLLGPTADNYKSYALKNDSPLSKYQPKYLDPKTDRFIIREYYCPKCAAMFEVEVVTRDEKDF